MITIDNIINRWESELFAQRFVQWRRGFVSRVIQGLVSLGHLYKIIYSQIY
jgi:hypothetical protein